MPVPFLARQLRSALLLMLGGVACTHSNNGACVAKAPDRAEAHDSGYVVEWTAGEDWARYDAVCRGRSKDFWTFEIGLVRGAGQRHLGAKVRRALEASRFREVELDGWAVTYACGTSASFVVTLNAKKNACKLERALELIGEALAQQNADDRVVVRLGLWEAPAL